MHRRLIVTIILLSSLIISGCYNRLEVDETVIVVGYGVDIKGEQKVFSAQLALPAPRMQQAGSTGSLAMIVTEPGQGFAEAARRVFLTLPRTPVWSMTDTMIMSEKLAREDIGLVVDFLARNRFLRNNLFLFLSKGTSPEEIYRIEVPPENYSALALEKMIKAQEKQIGIYIPVKQKDFLYKSATAGIEPVIPQVIIEKSGEQKRLKLEGTAVFRDQRMVGSLNEQESRGFRYLSPQMISGGLFIIESPTGNTDKGILQNAVTLELIRSRTQIEPVLEGNKIKMNIKIEAEGNFYEQSNPTDLASQAMIKNLEIAANKTIKRDIQKCIDKAQLLKSDILGWGLNISRYCPQEWEQLKNNWPQDFARVESEISVDFKIRRSYLLEQAFKFNN